MAQTAHPDYIKASPILVVDDDPTQRLMFKKVLEQNGLRVIEAENGLQALALFNEHRPILALVDAVMPEMDGFTLCKQLIEMDGDDQLTVLMATSLNDDTAINNAFKMGAADFISKPINWTVFKGRVAHLLRAKFAEQQVRKTEELLRQSQKMNAIGNLTSGIAHEFNNILSIIIGNNELLKETLAQFTEIQTQHYTNEIYKSAIRARDLISQMQQFSQTRPGAPQWLQLDLLLKENLKILSTTLPASINIRQYYADKIPLIKIDPVQFQQSLTNLLLNARDAIQEKGKGIIDINLQQLSGISQICNSCHSNFEGDFIQLKVTDNGCGISQDVQEKMFDPYYTTKPVGRGTGMGLSVIHGIMHEMHGHILVNSQVDQGTSICLLFPVSPREPNNRTTDDHYSILNQDQTAPDGVLHHRILIVDDELSITSYLKEILQMNHYEVTTCNNSVEALNVFMLDPAGIDLVITDMTLPDMTGVELATGMIRVRPDLPVILCSGYIDQENRQAIDKAGIRKSFSKPVDARELINSINKLLLI